MDDPLLTLENCLVVPHIASASINTRDQMSELATDNIINVLQGKAPLTPVNREAVERQGLSSPWPRPRPRQATPPPVARSPSGSSAPGGIAASCTCLS